MSTLPLPDFVALDKSHPFSGPDFLHGRSEGLVYMILTSSFQLNVYTEELC